MIKGRPLTYAEATREVPGLQKLDQHTRFEFLYDDRLIWEEGPGTFVNIVGLDRYLLVRYREPFGEWVETEWKMKKLQNRPYWASLLPKVM